ncbi:MAG: hypothetical protein FJ304_15205 [Planctomycetes bacterium]|nr:hypothetical protein [Planctomycetota bacterium]
MRRYITMLSALALMVAALGCQHIGGKCDCGYNASDYQIQGATNPYPTAPVAKPKAGGGNE